MRRAISLGVVAIVLSGCVVVGPPGTPGPGSSVATPGSVPAPSTPEPPDEEETRSPADTGTDSPREPSAFAGPREAPPGGVAELLEAIPGGGIAGPCDVNPPEVEPGIAMHESVIPTSLCGMGFIPGQEVALLVRGPGGREWTAVVTPDEFGAFEWEFEELPGLLQGEFFAQAIQGEASPVARSFSVELDSLEAAVVPRYFQPGGATMLGIAGGLPGQSVPVYLYRERIPGEAYDYVADLGPIDLNDNGQRRVELRSRRGDEQATYIVVVDPDSANVGYWFVLGPRPEQ